MDSGEATPARLKKALALGDSPVAPAVGRAVAFGVMLLGAGSAARALRSRFEEGLRRSIVEPGTVNPTTIAADVALVAAPLLGAAAVAAIVVGLAQTGGAVGLRSGRAREMMRAPGFAVVASGDAWLGAVRAVAVFVAIAAAMLAVVRDAAPSIAGVSDAEGALSMLGGLVLTSGKVALAVLVVAAALDVVSKRRAWAERWRYTPSEARRERRENETPEAVRRARAALRAPE